MSLAPDSSPPDPESLAAQPSESAKMSSVTVPVFVAGDNARGSQEPMAGAADDIMGSPGYEETQSAANGADKREAPTTESNGTNGQKDKKKKRLKKAATAMPKNRGTGFEEFYADPPITPEEAGEEEVIYSPRRPLEDRIEECMNRFRSRRRLQGELVRYFNEYLFLGGVDTSQRSFQGVDPKEYAAASAEEKKQLANVYGILGSGDSPRFYSATSSEHWSVDFSGVAAGYLSEAVPRLTWHNHKAEEETQRAIDVVANFLRYIIQHDVCNEYKDDVTNALSLCDRAKEELPLIFKAVNNIPCQFNKVVARVFRDGKKFEYVGGDLRKEPLTPDQHIFALGVLFSGPRDVYRRLKDLKVVHTVGQEEACSLKIVAVDQLDENARETAIVYGKYSGGSKSAGLTGVIRCEHVFIRDDLCRGDAMEVTPDRIEVLMIEESLLQYLRPGTIIRVTLAELNIGLKYMVNLPEILPSFYRFLPQVLMRHYKPPRPNERPAPSALDPVGEEEDAEAHD